MGKFHREMPESKGLRRLSPERREFGKILESPVGTPSGKRFYPVHNISLKSIQKPEVSLAESDRIGDSLAVAQDSAISVIPGADIGLGGLG